MFLALAVVESLEEEAIVVGEVCVGEVCLSSRWIVRFIVLRLIPGL